MFGAGAGDTADPSGLKQHSFNKYLSPTPEEPREAPPLAPGPDDEVGPSEGAVGRRGREVVRLWPAAELSPVSRGARGRGLALWHLHGVTQQQTGHRPMPGPHADPSTLQSQYLRSRGKHASLSWPRVLCLHPYQGARQARSGWAFLGEASQALLNLSGAVRDPQGVRASQLGPLS